MAQKEKRPNQNTVGSLADAISRRDHFPDAIAYSIAPLKVRSGARSWHGVNRHTNKWEKEHSDGVAFPDVDQGDEVPQLPPSPINTWEFCFIDRNGEIIRPTLTIDPSYNVGNGASQETDDSGGESRIPPAPRVDAGEPASLGAMMTMIMEISRQKDRHALAVLQATQINQQAAWDKLVGLVQIHEGMHARNEALRDQAIAQLKATVETNAELSNKLMEAQQEGQLHVTIRELFAGKPELLVSSFRELFIGLVEKLKT
jgi:hypothetical protein